jgi:hypothetical protein
MRGVSTRPLLIGTCTLLLGLFLGANAAFAAPSQTDSCESGKGDKASGETRSGGEDREDRKDTVRHSGAEMGERRSGHEGDGDQEQEHRLSVHHGGTGCTEASPGPGETTPAVGTVSATTETPTAVTVIPAGPISWAAGFGPNGTVATVQTAPRSIARLPSTSTAGDDELILWGIASLALGPVLLRAGGPVLSGGVQHRSATIRGLFRNLSVR